MAETCPKCGRPSGASGIGKDFHETCFKVGSRSCRIAAAGYAAGRVVGRIGGIDEGVRLAKAEAFALAFPDGVAEIEWCEVDKAAAAAKGGDHG